MSGVVLRCPNCGTTKGSPGECEACHEAQVRYFCTNHKPGRWLDAPACPQCGARFGEAPRPPAPPPTPAPTRRPGPAAPPRKAAGGPSIWDRGRRPPTPEGATDARPALRVVVPEALTKALSRVRRLPRRAAPVPDETLPRPTPALGGCLARALFLVVFLFVTLLAMSLLLGGSLFQVFGGYYY